ncbi:metal ABC transporter solute-binding protein, Zn/Mn family [Fructilactobacillus sp. Tb1]|uniref:metal ABC transporter solute-binding protein, Zn/Mn family n=1 Tax=Fructilactobacillus sp. Tb1 TaxID=3422304 RepID=UPI003D28B9D6
MLKHHKSLLIGVCLLLVLPLAACTNKNKTKPNKINVVTSVNFYSDVAKKVGGNHVKVQSIINSNVDPHDFEPTINDSKKVNEANVVIDNGVGYDDWMNNILASANTKHIKNITVATLLHASDGSNEHLWYNPATMPKLADKLAQVYSKQDPKHERQYEANAKQYQKDWQPIQKLLNTIKQNSHDASVAVSEPVFNYSLQAMGYKVIDPDFANSVDKGVDPSVQDISQLQNQIKHHQITFFVNNTQSYDPVVTNMVKLAKQNHIPIVNVTETQPKGKTYLQWMTDEYQQVLKIQQKQ